jgi:hypothetical protein
VIRFFLIAPLLAALLMPLSALANPALEAVLADNLD